MFSINRVNVLFYFLIFSSVLFKSYFPMIEQYYFQKIFVYCALLVIIMLIIKQNKVTLPLNKTTFFVVLLLSVVQFPVIFYNMYNLDIDQQLIIKKELAYIIFLIILYFHFYSIYLFKNENFNLFSILYKSIIYISIFVILINYLQLGYMVFPSLFDSIITLFANTIESKWTGSIFDESWHDFYAIDGSYVKTTLRLSGLMEEAPENASMIFMGIMPFLLGKILINIRFRNTLNGSYLEFILLLNFLLILVASRSSSGILFFVIDLFLLIYLLSRSSLKYMIFAISIISFLILSGMFFFLEGDNAGILLHFITKTVDIDNMSTNSRLAIVFATGEIFFNNMLFGIGRTVTEFAISDYLPIWSQGNKEVEFWIATNTYPQLSRFLGFIAEFGLLGFSILFYIIYRIHKKLNYLSKLKQDIQSEQVVLTFKLFIISSLIATMLSTVWFRSFYLLIFFAFVVLSNQKQSYKG